MTEWQATLIVAHREVRERLRSKMFRIGLFLTVLLVMVAMLGPTLVGSDNTPVTRHIGLVGNVEPSTQDAITAAGNAVNEPIEVHRFDSRDTAVMSLSTGEVDVVIVPDVELVVLDQDQSLQGSSTPLTRALQQSLSTDTAYRKAGLSASQTEIIAQSAPLPLHGMNPPTPRDDAAAASSTQGMILLFVLLTLFGAFILNGVIEEKSSRVVEILLSTITVKSLLTGRIIGIAVTGTIQGLVIAATALVARSASAQAAEALSLRVVALTVLWFLLGFAMYSWLYACAGALSSRAEDAQNLVFPLQVPLIVSYGVGMVGAMGGGSGVDSVLIPMSLFPLTAPMTMLERMSAGTAPASHIVISITLCIVTAFAIRRLALIIFTGGILRAGQRVRIRDAIRYQP